jgi:hypothetical protein
MRKLLLTTLLLIGCASSSFAQKGVAITESSIVKDTTGSVVPYNIWTSLMTTGRYMIKVKRTALNLLSIVFLMKNMRNLLKIYPSRPKVNTLEQVATLHILKPLTSTIKKLTLKISQARSSFLISGL